MSNSPRPSPRPAKPSEPWYAKGVKFTCKGTECGDCCSGRWGPGYVWVTVPEMQRLAAHLELEFNAFTRKYVRQVGDRYSLIEKPNHDCIFYADGAGCSVYAARPDQCRSYPYWPEVMDSASTWVAEATQCPGIECEGACHVPKSEIEAMLKLSPRRAPPIA